MKCDYNKLSPGIKGVVRWLHLRGWDTCDSGDGSNLEEGMECGMDTPMVVVETGKKRLAYDAETLFNALTKFLSEEEFNNVDIQAMYNPRDEIASILLTGEGLLSRKFNE